MFYYEYVEGATQNIYQAENNTFRWPIRTCKKINAYLPVRYILRFQIISTSQKLERSQIYVLDSEEFVLFRK